MAAEPAAVGHLDPVRVTRPVSVPAPRADDGHRILRLPGGEPRLRTSPISVRRTVGMPERRPATGVRRAVQSIGWGVAATVLAGGCLMLHQMLFIDSEASAWLSRSSASLTSTGGLRPLTNADPDLPAKRDLVARFVPAESSPVAPGADVAATVAADDTGTVASSDDSSGSGPGSGDESGDDSSGSVSGSGNHSGGDSSGPGSGDDSRDDSSGHGSGGGDEGSSGHGSGGGDEGSSGRGSGDS